MVYEVKFIAQAFLGRGTGTTEEDNLITNNTATLAAAGTGSLPLRFNLLPRKGPRIKLPEVMEMPVQPGIIATKDVQLSVVAKGGVAPAPLRQHRRVRTVEPGLGSGIKNPNSITVDLIVGMKWPKAVSTAPEDIHVTAQHRGRMEVPPTCRVALCTHKGPGHGAGIQLVDVIGKAVSQLFISPKNVHDLAQDTS